MSPANFTIACEIAYETKHTVTLETDRVFVVVINTSKQHGPVSASLQFSIESSTTRVGPNWIREERLRIEPGRTTNDGCVEKYVSSCFEMYQSKKKKLYRYFTVIVEIYRFCIRTKNLIIRNNKLRLMLRLTLFVVNNLWRETNKKTLYRTKKKKKN